MAYQATFQRYELKYLLTLEQRDAMVAVMEPYMALDKYGRTSIRNIYFDTDSYRLIRRSIEKPIYKEKLRLRSYGPARDGTAVFVELKKKYRDVVYKRRLAMPEAQALQWLRGDASQGTDCQIGREIQYFISYYQSLQPAVFLSYERQAWFAKDGSDLRITFDDSILSRQEHISLAADTWGTPLLPDDRVLMEIKTSGGIPLWMTHFLTENHIYKTPYSKYGTAYRNLIFPEIKGGFIHAR